MTVFMMIVGCTVTRVYQLNCKNGTISKSELNEIYNEFKCVTKENE